MPFPNLNGRPSLKPEDAIARIDAYLSDIAAKKEIPFIEEIAAMFGVDEDTIGNWAKSDEQFLGAIKRVKNWQKWRLKADSLNNKVNPASAIFQLKANHGMVETSRTELSGKDGGPIQTKDTSDPQKKLELLKAKIAEHEAYLKKTDGSANP